MNDVVDPKQLKGKERDTAMFLDWYQGMTQRAIAVKYGLSYPRVSYIKKQKNWQKNADILTGKQYSNIANRWKKMSIDITTVLENDINRFIDMVKTNPNTMLSQEDRTHLRMTLDSLNKITRLVEDKPTDIIANSGVVEHRVILHPKATHWGVIPPPDDVKVIEVDPNDKSQDSNMEELLVQDMD